MLRGLKTIAIAVTLSTIAGAFLGVFVAALVRGATYDVFGFEVPKVLLAVAIMGFIGANLGFVFAYGFLPESPEA